MVPKWWWSVIQCPLGHYFGALVQKGNDHEGCATLVLKLPGQTHRGNPFYDLQGFPTELTPRVIPCCINNAVFWLRLFSQCTLWGTCKLTFLHVINWLWTLRYFSGHAFFCLTCSLQLQFSWEINMYKRNRLKSYTFYSDQWSTL